MQNEGEAVPGKSFGSVEALKFACVNLSELPRVDFNRWPFEFPISAFWFDQQLGPRYPSKMCGATIQWHGGWDEFLSRWKHLGSLR